MKPRCPQGSRSRQPGASAMGTWRFKQTAASQVWGSMHKTFKGSGTSCAGPPGSERKGLQGCWQPGLGDLPQELPRHITPQV